MTDPDRLLVTLQHAADALGVSRRTVRRLIAAGELASGRIGRAWIHHHRYARTPP